MSLTRKYTVELSLEINNKRLHEKNGERQNSVTKNSASFDAAWPCSLWTSSLLAYQESVQIGRLGTTLSLQHIVVYYERLNLYELYVRSSLIVIVSPVDFNPEIHGRFLVMVDSSSSRRWGNPHMDAVHWTGMYRRLQQTGMHFAKRPDNRTRFQNSHGTIWCVTVFDSRGASLWSIEGRPAL